MARKEYRKMKQLFMISLHGYISKQHHLRQRSAAHLQEFKPRGLIFSFLQTQAAAEHKLLNLSLLMLCLSLEMPWPPSH